MDTENDRPSEREADEGTRGFPTYHPIDAVREPLSRTHEIDASLAARQIERWLAGGSP